MTRHATLRVATEQDIPALVALAADGTVPSEVMPPDDAPDPDRWTDTRRAAYATFLTSRIRPLDDGRQETTLVVDVAGDPVGVARLVPAPGGQPAAEVGVWLARGARGRGYAHDVLDALVERARAEGYPALAADTTAGNSPALATLQRSGAHLTRRARDGAVVDAALDLRRR